jgi:two-component sensor histidine kinase
MSTESLQHGFQTFSNAASSGSEGRIAAGTESELTRIRRTAIRLRNALARDEELLRRSEDTIQRQRLQITECDHRFLNDVQMMVSLLTLQGRASANPEVALQLAGACDRIAAIGRIHRRLHSFDGARTIAFRRYLEDLAGDYSAMVFSKERPERTIAVTGLEIDLPADTGIPLAFIASELITNAVKYGNGRVAVGLDASPGRGIALTVSNDGPCLPGGFDPAASTGLGMKIVRALAARIDGELKFGLADDARGVRFSVIVPAAARDMASPAQNVSGHSSWKRDESRQMPR